MNQNPIEHFIVSKDRVINHGEVYTGQREVTAMLDLVRQEAERIEARFLEPACGTGNFILEILARKMSVIESRYSRSQLEYERYSILAISSVYGIDILQDNVRQCRERLFQLFDRRYTGRFKKKAKEACRKSARHIIDKNIVWGDALTLNTVDNLQPIVFTEWSPVNGSMLKRREFVFHELFPGEEETLLSLFNPNPVTYSDLGERVFIPSPVREYRLVHFLRLADVENE